MSTEERAHELGLIREGQLLTQREKFLLDTIDSLESRLAQAEDEKSLALTLQAEDFSNMCKEKVRLEVAAKLEEVAGKMRYQADEEIILALIPTADQSTLAEVKRKARIAGAESLHRKIHKDGAACIGCVHIAAMRVEKEPSR